MCVCVLLLFAAIVCSSTQLPIGSLENRFFSLNFPLLFLVRKPSAYGIYSCVSMEQSPGWVVVHSSPRDKNVMVSLTKTTIDIHWPSMRLTCAEVVYKTIDKSLCPNDNVWLCM